MRLGLPRAIVHMWEGSRTGYVAVNWKQAFCGFSFGLDQALAHILCSTSTHLQQEITHFSPDKAVPVLIISVPNQQYCS